MPRNTIKNDGSIDSKMTDRAYSICGSVNLREYTIDDIPSLAKTLVSCFDSSKRISSYYFIFHTETNTLHFHYILQLRGQCYLKTMLHEIISYGFNNEAINIMKLGSLGGHLKYILHIDDKSIKEGKKMYEIHDIISNECYEVIEDFLTLDDDVINTDKLINICIDCGNIIGVMRRLGLSTFHKYREEVKLIFNYENQLRFARDIERDRRKNDELPF